MAGRVSGVLLDGCSSSTGGSGCGSGAADALDLTNHTSKLFKYRDVSFCNMKKDVFDPHSYPDDDNVLMYWGIDYLCELIDHYEERKTNKAGQALETLINRLKCEGEFYTFKTVMKQHATYTDSQGTLHFRQPVELMEEMFGPRNRHNQRIFEGKLHGIESLVDVEGSQRLVSMHGDDSIPGSDSPSLSAWDPAWEKISLK
ncbi:hypothetical protein JOB18_005237 [Solea senegalensis]|uniref:Uncharacterized protein n=1 Tax=Solea senegalensis TaxID=28829 RepID=A0AAV6RAI7_SOLSE|nr:hypothetical protein JOB18_005237 [Solea senegalensis]